MLSSNENVCKIYKHFFWNSGYSLAKKITHFSTEAGSTGPASLPFPPFFLPPPVFAFSYPSLIVPLMSLRYDNLLAATLSKAHEVFGQGYVVKF